VQQRETERERDKQSRSIGIRGACSRDQPDATVVSLRPTVEERLETNMAPGRRRVPWVAAGMTVGASPVGISNAIADGRSALLARVAAESAVSSEGNDAAVQPGSERGPVPGPNTNGFQRDRVQIPLERLSERDRELSAAAHRLGWARSPPVRGRARLLADRSWRAGASSAAAVGRRRTRPPKRSPGCRGHLTHSFRPLPPGG
jgi:hypothetical protein